MSVHTRVSTISCEVILIPFVSYACSNLTAYVCRNVHTQVPISSCDLVLISYEQLRRELAGRNCPLLT